VIKDTYKHKGQRKRLVELMMANGIKDDMVLQALLHVPRHFFFSKEFEEFAYEDKAFPIDDGQTISQPYTVAYQSELLQVRKGMKVLEIGTGSGYQASILAEMGAHVYTIERMKGLYEKAKAQLTTLGYTDIHFYFGDGTMGLSEYAPYDRIIVTAGAPAVPQALTSQLKEGGMLVIPVGDASTQKMVRITKLAGGELKTETFKNFAFVPLVGEDGWGR
jgi:protein-L-isoaspartate(D-aspartate) O-methyltransferase